MMHTYQFKELVRSTWGDWQRHLERFAEMDWEETDESLTIIMPDGRKYLFNLHTGMQQLWMASPISGGRHFSAIHTTNLSKTHSETAGNFTNPSLADAAITPDQPVYMTNSRGCDMCWTDTRNGEIIESVLSKEFSEHWNVNLNLTK